MITNNYKTSFYSGYSYLRPVVRGNITSSDNGFGAQEVNTTVSIPSSVIQRPPYIQYYFEYPTGVFRPVGKQGDVIVGNDSNTMYFNGFDSSIPFDAVFKVHYVIYDRSIT